MVTLGSFVVILWILSAAAPFTALGVTWSIPGYLVWAALIYSVLGTIITQWIGNKLVGRTVRGNDVTLTIRPRAQRLALTHFSPEKYPTLKERIDIQDTYGKECPGLISAVDDQIIEV